MSVPLTQASIKEPEILIDYEVKMLRSKLNDLYPRDLMMIDLALSTGLRNDEICSLTIKCIKTFEIITHILMLPGEIAKGGIARDIPLNDDIRKNLDIFLSWKITRGEDTNSDAFLFVSKFTHKKLNPRDFQRILSSISQKYIGRSIHPHVLRHTFASRLLKVSNLEIVRKCLGHKNIQTTQIYLHPSNDEILEAVSQI
ncbi:Tyrosine recombinase XerC [subsurface metagenome]